MKLRIQSTPNPRAQKYILSQVIKSESKVSYQDPESCAHVPLAHALMQIPGVVQVHFFEQVITVTQNGSYEWEDLNGIIHDIVQELVEHHDPEFEEHTVQSANPSLDLPPHIQEVENILDATIRPSLQMDGGDVEVLDFKDDVVTIRYLGACGGCPSALEGTLYAMKDVISEALHRNIEVVTV